MKMDFQSILEEKMKETDSIQSEESMASEPLFMSQLLGKIPRYSPTKSSASSATATKAYQTIKKSSTTIPASSESQPKKPAQTPAPKPAALRVLHKLTPAQTEALTMLRLFGAHLPEDFSLTELKQEMRRLYKSHHPDQGGHALNFIQLKKAQGQLETLFKTIESK